MNTVVGALSRLLVWIDDTTGEWQWKCTRLETQDALCGRGKGSSDRARKAGGDGYD